MNPPIIGQHDEAQKAFASSYFMQLYANLIPIVAQSRLRDREINRDEAWREQNDPPWSPDAIADEAAKIADAAMRRLGFSPTKEE